MINGTRVGLMPPWVRGMHKGHLMFLVPVRLLQSRVVCDEPNVWSDDGVELTPVYCDYSIMKVLGRRGATRGERDVNDAI